MAVKARGYLGSRVSLTYRSAADNYIALLGQEVWDSPLSLSMPVFVQC